jgi:hypothetical protein
VKYLVLLSIIYCSYSSAGWFSSDTTDAEVKNWLKHVNLKTSNLSEKELDKYRDQVDKLKNANYEVHDDLIQQKIKVLLGQGLTCSGDDKIKVDEDLISVYSYDRAFMNALSEVSNLSEDCKNTTLKEYMKFKYKKKDPLKSKLCKKKECHLIEKMKEIFEDNVATLIFNSYGERDKQAYCSIRKKITRKSSIVDLLESYEQINECAPLKIGESKKVDGQLGYVTQRYSIEKVDSNKFRATFNIDFGDISVSMTDGNTVSPEDMYQEVNDCLATTSPFMKDEDGRQLELKVVSPGEAQQIAAYKRPSVVKVTLEPETSRAHSKAYPVGIKCSTIIHELLHLAGLFDEYEETATGIYIHTDTGTIVNSDDKESIEKDDLNNNYKFKASYNDCRSISEAVSIMGDSHIAYDEIVPKTRICSCNKHEGIYEECIRDLSKVSIKTKEKFSKSSGYKVKDTLDIDSAYNSFLNSCEVSNDPSKRILIESELNEFKYFSSPEILSDTLEFRKNTLNIINTAGVGLITPYSYKCDCTGENKSKCSDIKNIITQANNNKELVGVNKCPSFMTAVRTDFTRTIKDIQLKPSQLMVTHSKNKKYAPMLRKAHFERIIEGTCTEKVKKYSTCAEFAYINVNVSCLDRPEYCKDESQWLDSSN